MRTLGFQINRGVYTGLEMQYMKLDYDEASSLQETINSHLHVSKHERS